MTAPLALFLILTAAAPAQALSVASDTLLVSTGWLAQRLGDRSLVVIHAGGTPAAYDSAHIPGARHLPFASYALRERDGLSTELPPLAQLESTLEGVGISDGARVVIVGSPIAAARLFMTLDYLGAGVRASILDGGFAAWRAEGRPVSTEAPASMRGSLSPQPRDVVVDASWVRSRLRAPGVTIVDARAPEFYAGSHEPTPMATRPGHIPGAVTIPFTSIASEQARFQDVSALRDLFRTAGIEPGDRVVTYCHIGMQASVVYFAARLLGYDARLYDGSYQDWSKRSDTAVER